MFMRFILLLLLFLKSTTCFILPNIIINTQNRVNKINRGNKINNENKINKLKIATIVSMEDNYLNNYTFNFSLKNIRSIDYDKKEDMRIKDLDNFKENKDTFPSFDEFLKKKAKAKENEEILKYFKEAEEKEKKIKKQNDNIEYTSKDLKLLNNVATIEWAKKWIHNMVGYSNSFPKFMYQDMFLMRDFARENITGRYFYIGYIPSQTRLMHGPYYIGSFELIPERREFQTHLIIQNPNYMIEDKLDTHRIVDFKKELVNMANDASVFFKFANLKYSSNERYYYSWLYEDN